MKRTLVALLFLLACAVTVSAQEAEFSSSGGTAGAITAAPGSGTAGRIPQFASATSVVDSKMLTSGTNSGTWTLYDSTLVNGLSSFVVRAGVAGDSWPTKLVDIHNNADTSIGGFVANGATLSVWADDLRDPGSAIFALNGSAYDSLSMRSSFDLLWSSGAMSAGSGDVGISRSAAGILAVTDGSTGQGGIGLSDSATNTVSDALILRHATSGTAAASFGTGLLFQGEDAAGNMQSMGALRYVYTSATDTSEDADLLLYNVTGGALDLGVTLDANFFGTGAKALQFPGVGYLYAAGATLNLGGGSVEWQLTGTALNPVTSNNNTIGSSSSLMKDAYVSTSIQGTRTKTLTDTVATDFVTIAIANNTSVGGTIEYTITYTSAGNQEIESGVLAFAGQNEAGTEAASVSAVGTALQLPAGTMTNVFAVTTGTDNMTISCDADSTALAADPVISFRVYVNSGTATVTPTP